MLISSTIAKSIPAQFLFNQYFYLHAHQATVHSFADKTIAPDILLNCVEISEGNYVSGYCAPFAGIECTISTHVSDFIKELKTDLAARRATSLVIKQAPQCYQTNVWEAIHQALLANGFKEEVNETNQYIVVNTERLFVADIDAQKRRRLNNAKKLGMRVELFDRVETDDWYNVYCNARMDKGFPITISKEDYYSLSAIPDVYTYAGVFLNDRLIANTVFVRVNKEVLYYFIAASDPAYAELSPTVLLIETLYEKAVQENYTLIDLGISSVDGVLNEGLHQFKKHVGAKDCSKRTYTLLF
ncbi:GNAT family N-acetyltransferase [Cytophaga aurantiaca]|uniref:GNAT family N-acetyltransferase n=1 Tax=Cytophaga aurantiaca TaxID=29530 RepID=UPI0003683211|nr:GNAT family N-acetyltransferase [Cytophaga aurantiaca]